MNRKLKLDFLNKGSGYNAILLQLLAMAIPTAETGRLLRFEVPWLFKKVRDLDVLKRLFVPLVETEFFKVTQKAAVIAAFKVTQAIVRMLGVLF